jgi:hypothetical protein
LLSSTASYQFLSPRSKYSPQLPVPKPPHLTVCTSVSVRDQASYPYSTAGTIIILYTLIPKFFERKLEDKRVSFYVLKCSFHELLIQNTPEMKS